MKSLKIRHMPAVLKARLRRAYRRSELRKLLQWFKGKTVHPALYLASAIFLVGAMLGLHYHLSQYFYVVMLEGREVGLVRDAAEIEKFLIELNECCCSFYGMAVQPEQDISLIREYRFDGEEDLSVVKETLKQQIKLVTGAQMLTVDQIPAVPVMSENEVEQVIDLLGSAYVTESENVKLIEVDLLEEIASMPCTVPPEEVCAPAEAAQLLLGGENDAENRLLLASRQGEPLRDEPSEGEAVLPTVHVQTVEEHRVVESIPFTTEYTYNDKMWHVQSNVLIPGEPGEKEVTYHVTCRNGQEVARQSVNQTVLREPVARVVEKGTSRIPSVGTGLFLWPVQGGGSITQYFRGSSHSGIDITHGPGNSHPSILAADSGVVVETGSKYPQGNYIVIYHGNYYTVYLHTQVNYVSAGDKVSRGQTIALMGNTGRTRGLTGIHLHFEIRRSNGSGVWGYWNSNPAVNPLGFFNP